MFYAILALAAAWRSGFQILTKFDDAPVAFSLSALSATVYIIATFALVFRAYRLENRRCGRLVRTGSA